MTRQKRIRFTKKRSATKHRRHTTKHRRHITKHRRQATKHRRHLYRKQRQIRLIPGSQSVPLFTSPEKKNSNVIIVNDDHKSGNFVPGLRTYLSK